MANIELLKGASNLNLGASYSGGALPVDTDSLAFSDGGQAVNENTSALIGVTLANFDVRPAFFGDVGDAANYVRFDVSTQAVIGGASRRLYLSGGTDTGVWALLVVQPVGPCEIFLKDITVTTLRVLGGNVRCSDSCVLGDIEVLGPGNVIADAHASDTIGNVVLGNGGTLATKRRIAGTFRVGPGGVLEYNVDSSTNTGAGTLAGGSIMHRKGSLVVTAESGELDYAKLEKANASYALTLTHYEGARVFTGGVAFASETLTKRGKGAKFISK
jgi:hypothetical protein